MDDTGFWFGLVLAAVPVVVLGFSISLVLLSSNIGKKNQDSN